RGALQRVRRKTVEKDNGNVKTADRKRGAGIKNSGAFQLTKEKEQLCEEYEEKLSRKSSSDESGQLDKLRRENESLSCQVQRFAGEKAELLRENNHLKEELYRKTMEMSKLLTEKEELELKIQELTNKQFQLAKEKEELCKQYEKKLIREK
ncbi:trichohyalin-like, partial [Notechis scutatus]|uniref:Trichohyalin-like n=1 Tax=Notechis scutatus TaxID=8663 RepID=A0A6J1W343_9SAUR